MTLQNSVFINHNKIAPTNSQLLKSDPLYVGCASVYDVLSGVFPPAYFE